MSDNKKFTFRIEGKSASFDIIEPGRTFNPNLFTNNFVTIFRICTDKIAVIQHADYCEVKKGWTGTYKDEPKASPFVLLYNNTFWELKPDSKFVTEEVKKQINNSNGHVIVFMSQLMQILRPAIHKDIDEEYNLLKNDVRGNSARVETSRAPVKKTAPNEYNALLERLNQLEKKLNKKKTKKNDLIPKGGRKPNDVSRDKELALKLQKEYDEEAASPKKDAEQNVENPFTTILGNGKIPSRKLWSEYPSDN